MFLIKGKIPIDLDIKPEDLVFNLFCFLCSRDQNILAKETVGRERVYKSFKDDFKDLLSAIEKKDDISVQSQSPQLNIKFTKYIKSAENIVIEQFLKTKENWEKNFSKYEDPKARLFETAFSEYLHGAVDRDPVDPSALGKKVMSKTP